MSACAPPPLEQAVSPEQDNYRRYPYFSYDLSFAGGSLPDSPLRQTLPAIPEDDRIDKLAALHAAPRQEVGVTAILQKIETLFDDHEASAPPTERLAHKVLPLGVHRLFQGFFLKFGCLRHRGLPSMSPRRVSSTSGNMRINDGMVLLVDHDGDGRPFFYIGQFIDHFFFHLVELRGPIFKLQRDDFLV